MPRQTLQQELKRIQDEVLVLGSMVENALVQSVEMLSERDMEGAKRLIKADQLINKKRFNIEQDVLTLIATQQPMAGDLRTVAGVLEIITELERMGDYAKGIARINLMMGEKPLLKPLLDIPRMAKMVQGMLHRALDAFTRRDVELARELPKEDDAVDDLYNQVYHELLVFMMKDPQTIDQASYLLWVAHNLERVGDRVTNICERVVFTVTGEMKELDTDEDWN
ncbi:MAG: phosphate signaling complex protein PhoU [Chloroflexi bacterium]|nr:phosphate signaling complex protein PhoU [Chloroflexota bacterium]